MAEISKIVLPHGGYRNLIVYRKSDIIYQGTVVFCRRFLPAHGDRTVDQMTQAARSCKQNIAEGSAASGTSKETEIKLTNVARATLDELLEDYLDYLKAHDEAEWAATSEKKTAARNFSKAHLDWSDWKPFFDSRPAATFVSTIPPPRRGAKITINSLSLHGMFGKEVYEARRRVLRERLAGQTGIALFLGNAESPAQYRDNCYKWRQDSTWLYFFGIDEPRFAAILDLDSGTETVYADDFSLDDIVWMGPMPSVQSLAEKAGVAASAPYAHAFEAVKEALAKGRKVHTVPPSRYYNEMLLNQLGVRQPSEALIRAIVSLRLIKEPREIELIDASCDLGYEMHSIARKGIRIGRKEQEIVGAMEAVALAKGWGVSFPTILTQHGEIFHCHSHEAPVEPGKLMVIDAGVESNEHYASDYTRTYPTGGRYTSRQRDIYSIVYECNEYAFSLVKPGVAYRDVHIAVAERMLERLRDLGLVSGDSAEMAARGIAGLFMPHGLGHNMGLDVHDMEDLGEDLVGYDDDQKRASLPGLRSLRMARRLVPGNVITDEPGIYFIPALIAAWKQEKRDGGCVNYARLEAEFLDFGGIRVEDDVLVTPEGARRLGGRRLPAAPDEVEEAMKTD